MPPTSKTNARRQKASTSDARVKSNKSSTTSSQVTLDTPRPSIHTLPIELQQIILNVFSGISVPLMQDPAELKRVIQQVKGHLYTRDFLGAFGQPSYVEAYAVRWSAARALGYANIFTDLSRSYLWSKSPSAYQQTADDMENTGDADEPPALPQQTILRVACVGGGAGAELVALTATRTYMQAECPLEITAIDIADWSEVVASLSTTMFQPPTLSLYATDAAKARPENQALLSDGDKVSINFVHQDVLSLPASAISDTFASMQLVTLMFTLNELFSTSIPKTTSFLLGLTAALRQSSHLLVVDSPGSYSEIALGENKGTKQYPMKWLLDHTLLKVAGEGQDAKWEKTEEKDSVWFRIEKDRLKYPVDLENMRYQIHVYRRL